MGHVHFKDRGSAQVPGTPHLPTGHIDPGPSVGQITLHWTPAATGPAVDDWGVGWRVAGTTGGFTTTIHSGATRSVMLSPSGGTAYEVVLIPRNSSGGGRSAIVESVEPLTNSAPTVANEIPDGRATPGTAFSYTFPADTFNDADGDTLTYTAAQDDDSALPSWLTFTAGTRTFSGTPQTGDIGTVSVKVTASDGTDSVSDTFDIVVRTNSAPTVANRIPHQNLVVGTAFSYTFPANTFEDADGDTLTYTSRQTDGTALPSWLTFTAGTRTFSGTPPAGTVPVINVLVVASDGIATAQTWFNLSVKAGNTAPTVAKPMPRRTAEMLTPFSYTFPADTFNDADGDTLTYTAAQPPFTFSGRALPSWLTFDAGTRTFSGTPTTTDYRRFVWIEVTASDGTASVSNRFKIDIEFTRPGRLLDAGIGGCASGCPHVPTAYAEPGPEPGEITVHWKPNATGPAAATWTISSRKSGSGSNFLSRGGISASTRSYTISNLDPGVAYDLRLTGNGAGTGKTGRWAQADNVITRALSTEARIVSATVYDRLITVKLSGNRTSSHCPSLDAWSITWKGERYIPGRWRRVTKTYKPRTTNCEDRRIIYLWLPEYTQYGSARTRGGDKVTLSYDKSKADYKFEGANFGDELEVGGAEVGNFDDMVVTNLAPHPTSATVNGNVMKVTFDQALDESRVPRPGSFQVSAPGYRHRVGVTEVSISGSTVTLTLSEGIPSHATRVWAHYYPGGPRLSNADGYGVRCAFYVDSEDVTVITPNTPPVLRYLLVGHSIRPEDRHGIWRLQPPPGAVQDHFLVVAEGSG